MNAKTYLGSHRDDRIPPFALTPYSAGCITERLQARAIVAILDPKTLVIIAGPYEQLTPVNYSDGSGHIATEIIIGIIAGAIIGAGIGFGSAAYIDYQNDGQLFNGDVAWYDYLGATVAGGIVGGVLGAGAGYFSTLSWTFTMGASGLTGSGALAIPLSVTITGSEVLAGIAGLGLAAGSIMFSKHNPGMSSRSPRSWLTQEEGIEAMRKFGGDANKAAEYLTNKHGGLWHRGAGTDYNMIKKWLDRVIRHMM